MRESDLPFARETALIREAISLQHAAVRLATSDGRDEEVCLQALIKLTSLQRELLWHGWQALVQGRLAAATQPSRIIGELTDYILAVMFSSEGATRLLSDKEWPIRDARAVAEQALEDAGATWARRWMASRHEWRSTFDNPYAHTSRNLLVLARADLESEWDTPPDRGAFATQVFRSSAYLYADTACPLVWAILFALGQRPLRDPTWRAGFESFQEIERAFRAMYTHSEFGWMYGTSQ